MSSPPCCEKISSILTVFHVFLVVFLNAIGKFSDTFWDVHIEDPLHPRAVWLTMGNELNTNSTEKNRNFDLHKVILTTFYNCGMDFLVVETKYGIWKTVWQQKFRPLYHPSYWTLWTYQLKWTFFWWSSGWVQIFFSQTYLCPWGVFFWVVQNITGSWKTVWCQKFRVFYDPSYWTSFITTPTTPHFTMANFMV